ncbi:MAG: hypothetical protein ABII06_08765 [Pseudomonadota bacterium]
MTKLGVNAAIIDRIVRKAPVILKGEMTLGDARKYADAVFLAGGRVNIQEHGLFAEPMRSSKPLDIKSLGKFTMCPECGYKQLKGAFCERCGFLLSSGEAEGH